MLLNRIRPEIDPILLKNQNGFRQNRSTRGQILTIRRIIEGVRSRNLHETLLFIDFAKAFDSIHCGKMKNILSAYGIPTETVEVIMIQDQWLDHQMEIHHTSRSLLGYYKETRLHLSFL